MLYVKTPEETLALIEAEFSAVGGTELVSLGNAMGRVLAEDVTAWKRVHFLERIMKSPVEYPCICMKMWYTGFIISNPGRYFYGT